jgi:PleD family two-component response regulator
MSIGKVQARAPHADVVAAPAYGPAAITLFTGDESLTSSLELLLRGDRFQIAARGRPDSLAGYLSDRRIDAVLFDLNLPVSARLEVGRDLRQLRGTPTPIVALCDAAMSHESRLAALRDGFWDVFELPKESGELVAKLANWVSLKRGVDELRSGLLLDVETGHYTMQGMKRRLRELSALAQRTADALSCVLFGSDASLEDPAADAGAMLESARRFSLALHHHTRNSDIIGRLEPLKFVVLAPHTPPGGALRLAERFTSLSLSRRVEGEYAVTFSAGVAGVEGRNGQLQACPELLLAAASRALNQARSAGTAQVAAAW